MFNLFWFAVYHLCWHGLTWFWHYIIVFPAFCCWLYECLMLLSGMQINRNYSWYKHPLYFTMCRLRTWFPNLNMCKWFQYTVFWKYPLLSIPRKILILNVFILQSALHWPKNLRSVLIPAGGESTVPWASISHLWACPQALYPSQKMKQLPILCLIYP